jgi:glycerophosphoryl diester phosphodiesterase
VSPPQTAYDWLARLPGQPPLVVAHRGASALAPENTLAAFRAALDLGCAAVECDVHLSADGVPVVIHDARVDRTTSGSGAVASLTAAQMRMMDAGAWFGPQFAGEVIPTLDEALEVCAGRARLFVELKLGGGSLLAEAALAAVARHPETDVAVISFDGELVQEVARRRPDLPLGFLIAERNARRHGPARAVQATRAFGAGFIAPQATAADDALVTAAHQAGLPVSVWTVDDPTEMRRLSGLGVDAITTNRPDVALRTLVPPAPA